MGSCLDGVSSMVNSLKDVSSRLLRGERPYWEKRYWKYVRQQKTPL